MLSFKNHIIESSRLTVRAFRNKKTGAFQHLYSVDAETNRKLKAKQVTPTGTSFYRQTQAKRYGRRANLFKRLNKEDKCILIGKLLELQEQWLTEATYQGQKVSLNKPMAGDVKKSKVYVDPDGDGKAQKVNFGDKNMTIKKNIPARRRSFRARHNCDNPGPVNKARYWSCRAW